MGIGSWTLGVDHPSEIVTPPIKHIVRGLWHGDIRQRPHHEPDQETLFLLHGVTRARPAAAALHEPGGVHRLSGVLLPAIHEDGPRLRRPPPEAAQCGDLHRAVQQRGQHPGPQRRRVRVGFDDTLQRRDDLFLPDGDQRAGEKREQDTMKLAREAELASLRQQLQPHFLFNSLNSISALAGSRPEEARKMIQQLSDFLRGTIKKDDQQLVSLQEELKHLQLYLDIEKVRFGHRLKTEVERPEEAMYLMMPSLLLQPLVENAIKFGLYDTVGDITIRIMARKQHDQLVIRIENPFDPQTALPRQGTGFGLNSVQRRLYLLYARNDLMTTQQIDTVFVTEVKIPQPV